MMPRFEPRIDILPPAQREIWALLRPAATLGFVLYGGTAIALHLGHRASLDFDFFRTEPLDKSELRRSFAVFSDAAILQDSQDTLVVSVRTASGSVKVSFFGAIGFGRVGQPLHTADQTLSVASLDDLMSTKLKTILDRAEMRDYQDIAAMLRHGGSLERGLGAFKAMFNGEPATVLRAIGWFKDGDLPSIKAEDQAVLLAARDGVRIVPQIKTLVGSLAGPPRESGA